MKTNEQIKNLERTLSELLINEYYFSIPIRDLDNLTKLACEFYLKGNCTGIEACQKAIDVLYRKEK